MNDAQDELGATHHHGTDESATSLNKRPGFLSDRGEGQGEDQPWQDTGHGESRTGRRSEAAREENWRI